MLPKPRTQLIYFLLAWFVLGVACVFFAPMVLVFKLMASALFVLAAVDVLWLMRLANPSKFFISRQVNKNLPVQAWSEVVLSVHHDFTGVVTAEIFDHYPAYMDVVGQPSTLKLPTKKRAKIHYRIRPFERGDAVFEKVDVRISSPLKLWHKRISINELSAVRIYPNFAQLAKYTLLATDNRLSQMGLRKRQRRGEGQDFRQLRAYRQGDSVKQIDWKATARRQSLISREYQDERDQQVVFLLDCGRRMRHKSDDINKGADNPTSNLANNPAHHLAHLDQALNAMLLLSLVALRQGDAAGFLSFAGKQTWVAPKKGTATVQKLLDQSYSLASTMQPADYVATAKKLLTLQRKRALVVLITNTRDEDSGELKQALSLLSRKHLVVLADLRETALDDMLAQPINDLDTALTYHSTLDYLSKRKQTHDALAHAGAICLDTTAPKLPIRLVNTYLDIKQGGRL